MSWHQRLSNLFRRDRVWHEIDRELAFHLHERVDELKASGMPEDEALRLAKQQLGAARLHLEDTRAIDIPAWLESVAEDLRYALRNLWRNASLSGAVVATLTLGIGLNASIFTLIDGFGFRPFVEKDPGSFVWILASYSAPNSNSAPQAAARGSLEWSDYLAMRQAARGVHDFAAWQQVQAPLELRDTASVRAFLVTCNFFGLHSVHHAELGRLFEPADCAEGLPTIVLTHELWQDRFDSDPQIVGKSIHYNGRPVTVIGVARLTAFAGALENVRAWIPHTAALQLGIGGRFTKVLQVAARLNPSVSRQAVASELTVIARQQDQLHPNRLTHIVTTDGSRFADPQSRAGFFFVVLFIMGILLIVVLMSCANVATLLLSRAAGRHREIAVRLALGAGSGRLVRMLLTENAVLAAIAGAASLYVVYHVPDLLFSYVSGGKAFPFDLNWRVFTYLAAVTGMAAVLSGLAPAFEALNVHIAESLKGGPGWSGSRAGAMPTGPRIRSFLVAGQVSLSLVLLIGAGICIAAYGRATLGNPGFDTRHVVGTIVRLNGPAPKSWSAFNRNLADSVRVLPGVEATASALSRPVFGLVYAFVHAPGEPPVEVQYNAVSPDYFATVKLPIERGRALRAGDPAPGHGAAPVVVSSELARQFWPGQDALGKTLRTGGGDILEVAGLAPDTAVHNLGSVDKPTFYQMWDPASALYAPLVRFRDGRAGDGAAMSGAVRAALQRALPDAAVDARVIQSELDQGLGPFRSLAVLITMLGAIALALALIGIYGVVSFAVKQRTKEVGIRIALGAQKPDIFRAILVDGLRPIGVGLLVGMALALAVSRMVSVMLRSSEFHLNTGDPGAYAAVSIILTGSAVAAMIGPALRAAACNPIDVLREE